MNEVRYYEGRVKTMKLTRTSTMGVAMYELLEDGKLGNKKWGFRDGKKGELNTCPTRRCIKKRK